MGVLRARSRASCRRHVDRAPADQFSDLGGKACGIGQCHPATLTQANRSTAPPSSSTSTLRSATWLSIDNKRMSVLAERQSVTNTRSIPARCSAATRLCRGAESVIAAPWSARARRPRSPIRRRRSKSPATVPWPSPAPLLRVANCGSGHPSRPWSDCRIYEFSRHGRGKFTRGFGGERRPEECGRKLWAAGSTHVDKSSPGSRLRHWASQTAWQPGAELSLACHIMNMERPGASRAANLPSLPQWRRRHQCSPIDHRSRASASGRYQYVRIHLRKGQVTILTPTLPTAQRPVICCRCSGYRAPCTVILETASSISRISAGLSSIVAAPMFSSRRCSFVVPGIGTIHGF